eukprot:tig00020554_g10821.t1
MAAFTTCCLPSISQPAAFGAVSAAACTAPAPRACTPGLIGPRRSLFGTAVNVTFAREAIFSCRTQRALPARPSITCSNAAAFRDCELSTDQLQLERISLESAFRIDWTESLLSGDYALMALQVPDAPVTYLQTPSGDPNSEFNLNAGKVVRTLREDLPQFFERGLSYDIYAEDMIFRDGNVTMQGLKVYQGLMWSLRTHGRMMYSNVTFSVRRMHQATRDQINVRFTISGQPRIPGQEPLLYEGCSVYKLNSKGLVREHQIDNVITLGTGYASPLQRFSLNPSEAAFATARVRNPEEDISPRM